MGPTGTGAIADNSGNIVQSGVTQTVVKKTNTEYVLFLYDKLLLV